MNFRDQFNIYFIKPIGQTGPIKIGISSDPVRRLAEFGGWSPVPLELIGSVSGTWHDEQFLHDCLASHHLHGEWFNAAPAVLDATAMVVAEGGFEKARQTMQCIDSLRSKKNRSTRAKNASVVCSETAA